MKSFGPGSIGYRKSEVNRTGSYNYCFVQEIIRFWIRINIRRFIHLDQKGIWRHNDVIIESDVLIVILVHIFVVDIVIHSLWSISSDASNNRLLDFAPFATNITKLRHWGCHYPKVSHFTLAYCSCMCMWQSHLDKESFQILFRFPCLSSLYKQSHILLVCHWLNES